MLLLIMTDTRTLAGDDAARAYKRGDVVEVREDGGAAHDFVTNPIASPFVLIRVADVTKAAADKYMSPVWLLANGRRFVERRRRYSIRIDDLPQRFKKALTDNRYVEMTRAQISDYCYDKVTLTNGMS